MCIRDSTAGQQKRAARLQKQRETAWQKERASLSLKADKAFKAEKLAKANFQAERKRRLAALEGFGVDLRELRKAMARVAAVADAKAVGPGRASARAARCVVTPDKDTPGRGPNAENAPPKTPPLALYESGAALHAVLDRLAGMETVSYTHLTLPTKA